MMNLRLFCKRLIFVFFGVLIPAAAAAEHGGPHYGELVAHTTGNGKVYVSDKMIDDTSAITEWSGSAYDEKSKKVNQCPNDVGESQDNLTFYCYAEPDYGYIFEGWKEDNSGTFLITNPCVVTIKAESTESTKATTKHYYAHFKEAPSVTINMISSENGSYTYTSETKSGNVSHSQPDNCETKALASIRLVAKPDDGCQFFAWYLIEENGNKRTLLSTKPNYVFKPQSNCTIEAEFIPNDKAMFVIKGTTSYYHDLNKACEDARSASDKTVVLSNNGVLYAGDYTVPEGVTLLIPFDDAYTVYTEPNQIAAGTTNKSNLFRTLTLATGASLKINGAICVCANQGASTPHAGCVTGKYGQIEMQQESIIEMNSGSNLYAWGFVIGEGEIIAHKGAVVHENFQITDFRGGNASSSMRSGTFPFNQYYVQNIETSLRLEYGAIEKIYTCVKTALGMTSTNANFIGNATDGGLFQLKKDGGWLTKRYDGTTDRLIMTIHGDAAIKSLSMKVYIPINTQNYSLPINSNMSVVLETGTMEITNEVELLPGVEITIKKDAILQVSGKLHIYDGNEWGAYANQNVSLASIGYAPSKKYNRTNSDLKDVHMDIQGKLICQGAVYTTQSGADICCTQGSGVFVWETKAVDNATTYQVTQSSSNVSRVPIQETPAKLHNLEYIGTESEYTETANSNAGTTFVYCESSKKWELESDCQGYYGETLDMVDWTNEGPLFNMMKDYDTSVDWTEIQYVGKSTNYTKENGNWNEEEATMVLPIAGLQPDETFQLKVLNGATEVSFQEYTVPYVIDKNTTISELTTDYSSIIFVHSGTLTIDKDATLATIYVDPGAELLINDKVTFTAGKIVLRTSPDAAAILTNNGTVSGQVYYSRIIKGADALKNKQIAFPYEVDLTKVVLSNGKAVKFGKKFGLLEYDSDRRATEGADGYNWKGVSAKKVTTMSAAKGYQIMSPSAKYHEFCFPVSLPEYETYTVNVTTQDKGELSDRGWNFLCSPFAKSYADKSDDPSKMLKILVYRPEWNYYDQIPAETLQPAMPFFYQATANGTLSFERTGVKFTASASAASLVKQQAPPTLMANVETQWLQLTYGEKSLGTDQTNIYLHPFKFYTAYQTGYDVAKFSTAGTRPFVWSSVAYGDLAFAALPDSVAEQGIALTVFSPAATKMTFSLRENRWLSRLEHVYLIDKQEGTQTDLLFTDYAYDAAKGTQRGRFVVQPVFHTADVVTDILMPDDDAPFVAIGANREIWVSHLTAGTSLSCYDLMGRLVYSGVATSEVQNISVATPGIYFVHAMDTIQKVIVKP